ncbi:MAG: YicC/YloC family endoribonuclease [Bacilli bacterium]
MTGYGKQSAQLNGWIVDIEMKSVNHRFLEYNNRLPRLLFHLETKLKHTIAEYVKRGRIEVYLSVHHAEKSQKKLRIDWELAQQYMQYSLQVKEKFGVELSAEQLFLREDVVTVDEDLTMNEETEKFVIEMVRTVCLQVVEMRSIEGQQTAVHLNELLNTIEQLLPMMVLHSERSKINHQERLTKRLQEWRDQNPNQSFSEQENNRIALEFALFADKVDITEEVTRLKSHCTQFQDALNDTQPVGRKLEFLLQEMGRECNTMGSKTVSSDCSQTVVQMKAALEKMREQVQNIE